MKSDREFLEGVYEKVKAMRSIDSTKTLKPKRVSLFEKWQHPSLAMAGSVVALAMFIGIVWSGGAFDSFFDPAKRPQVIQTRFNQPEDVLINQATSIVEVSTTNNGKELTISASYKQPLSLKQQQDVLDKLKTQRYTSQKGLVFITIDQEELTILDIFIWDEKASVFVNSFGETIRSTALLDIDKK